MYLFQDVNLAILCYTLYNLLFESARKFLSWNFIWARCYVFYFFSLIQDVAISVFDFLSSVLDRIPHFRDVSVDMVWICSISVRLADVIRSSMTHGNVTRMTTAWLYVSVQEYDRNFSNHSSFAIWPNGSIYVSLMSSIDSLKLNKQMENWISILPV